MAKCHSAFIGMNQDGTYCSFFFFISVPAQPSAGFLWEPCLGKKERAPVKHWVTEVCCWPVAPWLVTSTDIHRWRLVAHTLSRLQTAEWNWNDLSIAEKLTVVLQVQGGIDREVEKRKKTWWVFFSLMYELRTNMDTDALQDAVYLKNCEF